jgi:hypothetical protein
MKLKKRLSWLFNTFQRQGLEGESLELIWIQDLRRVEKRGEGQVASREETISGLETTHKGLERKSTQTTIIQAEATTTETEETRTIEATDIETEETEAKAVIEEMKEDIGEIEKGEATIVEEETTEEDMREKIEGREGSIGITGSRERIESREKTDRQKSKRSQWSKQKMSTD